MSKSYKFQKVCESITGMLTSPYMVHFFRATSQAEHGAQVKSNAITMKFSKARDKAEIEWGGGTPATFHEQRSLTESLYEA
ncbi:hypothetical protein [Scandinavium sp.]|uniref:hypothetical protein n=1 Tax=Scandinavium sp. TaxID=2830653 RepID=UPI00390C56AB